MGETERKKKVLIFIVSYNAEKFIGAVLNRIPAEVWHNDLYSTEALVIDDESSDETFFRAVDYQREHTDCCLTILRNAENQGYGGNQKLGYHYALNHGFDVVVLLHGDGQYAPECLPDMVTPILDDAADVVLGSRMMRRSDALRGGMPVYKWIGNQVLTALQNRILKAHLSEFHSGYRAYRVQSLASIPFQYNSDYFDFDTDIIIQLLGTGQRVLEIPIPTYYGDEICRVNGVRYGLLILRTSLLSRLVPFGILYDPKFDYVADGTQYTPKLGFSSSHQFALERIQPGTAVLDLGCGPGFMAEALAPKKVILTAIDKFIHPQVIQFSTRTVEADIETYDFTQDSEPVDTILLLDIIEHLRQPEALLEKLRQQYAHNDPNVIITTGNIGFFVVRFGLLFGQFNYGKRGILDMDHTRLFTFRALRRALANSGYIVLEEKGIPAPYSLAIGDNLLSRFLLALNRFLIVFSKGLFAYQIALVAQPQKTLEHLLQDAHTSSQEQLHGYDRKTGTD
jgi:glycosyltransferase involved in cell wall biosynthesis